MSSRSRILLVSAKPARVERLVQLLRADHRLARVASGEEALEVGNEFRPELVILDTELPGMDGLETCRRLCAGAVTAAAKRMLVTGRADLATRLAGYEAGADDVIVEPFEPLELVARVRVLLRLHSAEQIRRLRHDLVGLLHHESRTPLSILLGAVDLVRERVRAEPDGQGTLEMMDEAVRRLQTVFEKVTTLSVLTSDPDAVNAESVDLSDHLNATVSLRRPRAEALGVRLRSRIDRPVIARFDPRHVEKVFGELLDNALRFTPAGGRVTLEDLELPDRVVVRVVNTGEGIPPERIGHLGGAFTVGSLEHHQRGHGLGLAIAGQIVRCSGGALRVDSEPGRGTIVSVSLARGAEAAPHDEAA